MAPVGVLDVALAGVVVSCCIIVAEVLVVRPLSIGTVEAIGPMNSQ